MIRQDSLEYDVIKRGNFVIKKPKHFGKFQSESDLKRLRQLGSLAPKTTITKEGCLKQEFVDGRFANEEELIKASKLIKRKGLCPRGLLYHDVIITQNNKIKVIDVGGFERISKENQCPI